MASTIVGDGSGPANSLTMTLWTKSRIDAIRPSWPYGARYRAPGRVGVGNRSSTKLSALGLNRGPVVSKLPGRVDIFGMKNLALPAPLTWQVPQLTPACRANPPRIPGELKARLPRLTIYDLPPAISDRNTSRGLSSASSLSSVFGGSVA